MTKEGMIDVRKRLLVKYPGNERMIERDVRTVASMLVNGCKIDYNRLFIDEALMMHAGTIGFLAYLTGVQTVIMIGNVNQIPFVDRDHICPLKFSHPSVFCDIGTVLKATYRCPIDVAYSLSRYYDGIYSMSGVVKSMRIEKCSEKVCEIDKLKENCLYVVHFQSDKDYLIREGYGKGKNSKVLTIHESQGLTYDNVIMMRLNSKPLLLYDRLEYSIVAVSRHRKTFVYYTDVYDVTCKLIEISVDVDENTLREWNVYECAKDVKVGGCLEMSEFWSSPIYLSLNGHGGEYEDAVMNVPHGTHGCLRPKLYSDNVSFELAKYPTVGLSFESDLNYLQMWYDDKMVGVGEHIYENDQLMMELSDTNLVLEKIKLDPSKGIIKISKFGKLRPRLRTMISSNRLPSLKESLLGAVKRNLNAPMLVNDNMSPKVMAEFLVKNFVKSAIDEECMDIFESYVRNPVVLDAQIVDEWLNKQPPSVRKNACSVEPLHLRSFNR